MAKKKTSKPRPRVFYDDGKTRIEYVGRALHEIKGEILRVDGCLKLALKSLRTMRRSQHPAVRAAIFTLENIQPKLDSQDPKELARISYLMGDALQTLAVMKNSNADYLKSARFHLLYGQTPKKRDREAILGGKKTYTDRDETHYDDPEA